MRQWTNELFKYSCEVKHIGVLQSDNRVEGLQLIITSLEGKQHKSYISVLISTDHLICLFLEGTFQTEINKMILQIIEVHDIHKGFGHFVVTPQSQEELISELVNETPELEEFTILGDRADDPSDEIH